MIVLVIMLFMYLMGVVKIGDETNFAFTFATLILSISMSIDTFSENNNIAEFIEFILEIIALLAVVLLPNLKNVSILEEIMSVFDTNVMLLMSLFFTFAGQWAAEIKWKDGKKGKKD